MKFNWFNVNLLAFIYLYCAFVFEVLWVHLLVQEWSAFPDWGNYQAVCKDRSDGGLGPLWHTRELHIWGPVLHWRTWRHDRSSRMVWSKTGSQKYVCYSYVVNFAYNMCLDFSTRTLNMIKSWLSKFFHFLSQMKLGLVCTLWRTAILCRRHTQRTVAWPRPLASLTFSWALVTLACSTHPAPASQHCPRRWHLTAEYLTHLCLSQYILPIIQ